MEDFTEQEIEDEIQVLVETKQSMEADKEVLEDKELMSVGTAMTATRHIRRLLQSTGAPIEVLEGLSKVERLNVFTCFSDQLVVIPRLLF